MLSYLETVSKCGVSIRAIMVLAAVFVAGFFMVGYEQGQTAELLKGFYIFDGSFIHEFSHDARHAMGFACH